MIDTSLKKAERLLSRGTNAKIIDLKKSLETLSEDVVETNPNALESELLSALVFVQNEKLLDAINSNEIGFLETITKQKRGNHLLKGKD